MNKYANTVDRDRIDYKVLFARFAEIYRRAGRIPESEDTMPLGLYRGRTKIQWSREWEYPWALMQSGASAGHKIVDMGCGASPLPILLAEQGCTVIGIDNSTYDGHKQYNELRLWGLHPEISVDVDWRSDSMTHTTVESGWADVVFCIGVMEHLREDEVLATKKEFARITKKGGLLVMTQDFVDNHVICDDEIMYEGFELVGEANKSKENILNMGCDVYGWVQRRI